MVLGGRQDRWVGVGVPQFVLGGGQDGGSLFGHHVTGSQRRLVPQSLEHFGDLGGGDVDGLAGCVAGDVPVAALDRQAKYAVERHEAAASQLGDLFEPFCSQLGFAGDEIQPHQPDPRFGAERDRLEGRAGVGGCGEKVGGPVSGSREPGAGSRGTA